MDTEWNDVLRAKGIIPQKEKEITEEQIIDIVERTVQEKLNKGCCCIDFCKLKILLNVSLIQTSMLIWA